MKPISVLLLAASMLLFFGCAQEKPEEAAQKIFEQQLQAAAHEGLQMDPGGLDYDIVAESDGRALVEVTGLMPVKATLALVKQKGKWILDMSQNEATEDVPASH